MALKSTLVFCVLFLGLSGCVTSSVPDERFVRFFDELAFGGGTDGAGAKRQTLKRWKGPMIWSAQGSPAFRLQFEENMHLVSALSGRESKLVSGDAPIVVLQEDKPAGYPVGRDLTNCYINLTWNGDDIVSATVRIASNQPRRIARCAPHEIIHALGFRFHSAAIASVMSPFHGAGALTRWDAMAIRLLMSDRLYAGQSRQSVLAEARRALPSLRDWADALDLKAMVPSVKD